jgi:hypothetical protein
MLTGASQSPRRQRSFGGGRVIFDAVDRPPAQSGFLDKAGDADRVAGKHGTEQSKRASRCLARTVSAPPKPSIAKRTGDRRQRSYCGFRPTRTAIDWSSESSDAVPTDALSPINFSSRIKLTNGTIALGRFCWDLTAKSTPMSGGPVRSICGWTCPVQPAASKMSAQLCGESLSLGVHSRIDYQKRMDALLAK